MSKTPPDILNSNGPNDEVYVIAEMLARGRLLRLWACERTIAADAHVVPITQFALRPAKPWVENQHKTLSSTCTCRLVHRGQMTPGEAKVDLDIRVPAHGSTHVCGVDTELSRLLRSGAKSAFGSGRMMRLAGFLKNLKTFLHTAANTIGAVLKHNRRARSR